jgi:hypothetical protein
VPLVLVVAILAAFLIYGGVTRIGPTKFSRGGAFSVPVAPSPAPPSSAPPSLPSITPSGTRVPSLSPSPSGGPSEKPSPPTATPAPARGLALPRLGSYGVAIEGTERVRFGPVSFCSRGFPTRSTLVIKHAAGETPASFAFDHEFSSLHKERHIYGYSTRGVFLDFEGASVNCGGIEQKTENSFKPPELKVKLPLHVGDTWRGRSVGAHRTENYSARVIRREPVSVRGRAYTTYVIDHSVEMTGDERGRRSQRWWYAPALAMALRWHEEIDASRMGATYSESATFRITSLPA